MTFWRFLSVIISFYIFLLSLRVILSWFQGSLSGRPWEMLVRVTDPYLRIFSGLRFLRRGVFDFTPLAAILTLFVFLGLIDVVRSPVQLTLGIFLGIVVSAIWWGVRVLLLMFLILAILRAILLAMPSTRYSRITAAIGFVVEPAVSLVRRVFPSRQSLADTQYLYLAIVLLFVLYLLTRFLFRLLVQLFYSLPV